MKDLLSKQNLKLGGTFGVIAGVLTLLSLIPCLGIFFTLGAGLVILIGGYVVVMVKGGKKEELSKVVMNSVVASIPAAIIVAIADGIASVVGALIAAAAVASYTYGLYSAAPAIGTYIVTAIGGLIISLIWVVVTFIIGSIIAVYYPEEKLPAQIRDLFNKFKTFATR